MSTTTLKQSQGNESDVISELNVTPLIDVMLVLLIMLIITIPIQNHAFSFGPPGETLFDKSIPRIVTVDIDFDGAVSFDGAIINEKSGWVAALHAIGTLPNSQQPEVHVRASKIAEYKYVASVLATAQRLGVTKIGLIGAEQFL